MDWLILSLIPAGFVYLYFREDRREQQRTHEMLLAARNTQPDEASEQQHESGIAASNSRRARLDTLVILAPAAIILAGIAAWMMDAAHERNATADRLTAYNSGWATGWRGGCQDLFFRLSPTGNLYFRDAQYTFQWCLSLNDGTANPGYDGFDAADRYPSEGLARDEGYWNAFAYAINTSFSNVDTLCYGTECITLADYQE